jgi:hypothetical protein
LQSSQAKVTCTRFSFFAIVLSLSLQSSDRGPAW